MTRYVALLRGINVGGHKKIAMADLRTVLSGLGYGDVRTLLQSGNAVFTGAPGTAADAIAAEVEGAITREFGMTVRVLVRTAAELRAVVEGNPFGTVVTNPSRMMVTFLSDAPDPARFADVDPADYEPDRFALGERAIYQWLPTGILETRLDQKFWSGRLPPVATTRNWNTVTKLLELAEAGGP